MTSPPRWALARPRPIAATMRIRHFYHEDTSTLTYVVDDGEHAVVIDPVRDYDAAAARTGWSSCETVAAYVRRQGLTVSYVVDTHAHADHLSGLPYFKREFGAKTVTGALVGRIQATFRDVYHLEDDFPVDGRQFNRLVDEGEVLRFGSLELEAIHTPGHTPAHMSWKIGDAVFVGDTLFMPDHGSARCDFPGGSAAALYDSIQRIYALPDATRLFMCHDYKPGGRELRFETTVGEQKRDNAQIDARTTREAYVAFRREKDATLSAPRLLLPAIQVNIRAGDLPPEETNGRSYLKIPLDTIA